MAALLQEDRGVGPYGCRKSSSLTFPFRPRVVVRVEWDSHQPRVQSATSPLPHAGPRENEVASARDRGQMRVRGRFGQLGASTCCVSQVRKTAHQSLGTRKDIGEGNRSSRIGAPTAPRSAACGRRHSPVRPDSERRSTPTLQRRTARSVHEPELTENASTPSSLQETGVVWWCWY